MSFLNNIFGAGAQQALIGSGTLGGIQQCSENDLLAQQYASQANQYTQQLAQSMLATKNAVAQQVFTGQGIASTQPIKPFNPNEDAAYATPLSQLVTLWQANYGDKWVEVFEDDFWNSARVRLHNNDKLEGVGGWYRIKENA